MNDSSSLKTDHKELNAVFDFIHKLETSTFSTTLKHKNTVIKYTKIPDFDFDSKASWSHHNYSSNPRLRRIITLDDRSFETTRSLKKDLKVLPKMSNIYPKRKIITIEDGDDANTVLILSKDVKKSPTTRNSSKQKGTHNKDERSCSQRTISRITNASKNAKESMQMQNIPKTQNINRLNEIIKQNNKQLNNNLISMSGSNKKKTFKDISENAKKNTENTSRISLSKNLIVSVENGKDASATRKKQCNESCSVSSNKPSKQLLMKKSQHPQSRLKSAIDVTHKNKPVTVIHVPLDVKHQHVVMTENKTKNKIDTGTSVDAIIFKDTCVGTDPLPRKIDQITEISTDIENFCKTIDNISHTHFIKEEFDSLDIPKVTLKNERKHLTKKEIVNFYSASLPNLESPNIDIPVKDDQKTCDPHFHKSSSYIIGRATLTYRTERKIDFHVVGKNEEIHGNYSPSSLTYPLNVVSVFKKFRNRQCSDNPVSNNSKDKNKSHIDSHHVNDFNTVNCSYVSNNNKLVKPSDIISTIRVNNNLLQQSNFICEQFQRELNFIDSFFESLQYLERLSEKCFSDANFNAWIYNKQFEVNESEYISNVSKFENSTNVDDTETMASKSLCQLNLLIHNEQRRARDFLFVLKMQEDVLKDYIKSQMLWLEKKKKQDNIDISALKKKQRGALLKLQHECGEMQRMRKALLTLSEKRKIALMKTKKNIEMKLKNNVDVEQIIFGKKKLKRNTVGDRCLVPLKCFDLSSSGCEDSTTSRHQSESPCFSALPADEQLNSVKNVKNVASAEKSIQTGDSILGTESDGQSTSPAAENCVIVDGSYLNILFHNLSLPQIFSSGKQYEVNEEALKNIVNSSNSQNNIPKDRDVIEKFMGQIKNPDTDGSSTPSTAHSLVEEFDQYYKNLGEEDKLLTNPPECEDVASEIKDCEVQSEVNKDSCEHNNVSMISMDSDESMLKRLTNVYGIDRLCDCEPSVTSVEIQTISKEASGASVVGPLPVPAGAAAPVDTQPPDVPVWIPSQASNNNLENTTSDQVFRPNIAPIPYASPVHYEAEELRRQQLAIEREIKALEQQQCQLLVVREIPDKPPPPYTPPSESRTSKLPRMFLADSITKEKIQKHFFELANDIFDINDPFDAFVRDFCKENIERQKSVISDKPWDACNLLPQRPQPDTGQMINKTYTELKEVLSGVTPTYISGVGSRRSDHIDDILFAEWRRCEPEWTSLHTDEAIVKNQLFESIFQKILIETIDEYKKVVWSDKTSKEK